MGSAKSLSDPVHAAIQLTQLESEVVGTRAFQRLRNIKQLGLAYMVYPGADYSRFAHSVGVCHITGRIMAGPSRRPGLLGGRRRSRLGGANAMRWPVFLVFGFFALALDTRFVGILTLERMGNIAPHIVVTLAVFVCLFASRLSALSACLLLGVMMDLTVPPPGANIVYVIGPYGLGLLFGGYLILQMRTMVFRQRAVTIGALSFAATLAMAIVMIAIYMIRSWYGENVTYPVADSLAWELFRHIGIAIYTGLFAIPLGWLLLATYPLWGFQAYHSRRMVVH
jgi:cell shape-determining protein MreD